MTDLHTAARQAQRALKDAADAIAGRLENPATAMHNALIAEAALRAALEAQQEPVAYCSPESLKWTTHESETVVKLTRKAQPQHGFTVPLYDAPQPAHPPAQPQGWVPEGWAIEDDSGRGKWLSIRNLSSQCGQDFYPDRDPLIFAFLRAMLAARPQPKETT